MNRLGMWAVYAILVGSCAACVHRVIEYVGMPPKAAALTYCDSAGTIRSLLDAQLFRYDSSGLSARNQVPEILVHEAVHRQQAAARRKVGKCPEPYTIAELVQAEIEAYCAGFAVAVANGASLTDVGKAYALGLLDQFTQLVPDTQHYIASRWVLACPAFPLVWP